MPVKFYGNQVAFEQVAHAMPSFGDGQVVNQGITNAAVRLEYRCPPDGTKIVWYNNGTILAQGSREIPMKAEWIAAAAAAAGVGAAGPGAGAGAGAGGPGGPGAAPAAVPAAVAGPGAAAPGAGNGGAAPAPGVGAAAGGAAPAGGAAHAPAQAAAAAAAVPGPRVPDERDEEIARLREELARKDELLAEFEEMQERMSKIKIADKKGVKKEQEEDKKD